MTQRIFVALAAGGSAALLLAAFGFQHIGDMPPCKLCIWQRWPHVAAVAVGALALLLPWILLPLLGALAALTTAGIGAYHTGVERGWWEGPSTCSSPNNLGGMSTDDLINQIMTAPLVRCDEVPWALFGLSMASWNMLASLVLVILWIRAARPSPG